MTTLNWDPSARTLRQFAAIATVVLTVMAVLAHLRGRGSLAQAVPAVLAVLVALLGAVRPAALRLVYVLLSVAVFPIGFVVSHVILLVLFYGIITPLGVLARLARSDPLSVRRGPSPQSYWRARQRPRDRASYLRQA